MHTVLVYWWNVAPLCLCTLTFLLTCFAGNHASPQTDQVPSNRLVPTMLRVLAAVSLLRAFYFAVMLAWPSTGYIPASSMGPHSHGLASNMTYSEKELGKKKKEELVVGETLWQVGAILLVSLFVLICGAWADVLEQFKGGTLLNGKASREDAYGGSPSGLSQRRKRRADGFSLRLWRRALLAGTIVEVGILVLLFLVAYGIRFLLAVNVVFFAMVEAACMAGLTIYSRSVNVILDRVNVCGGPTTHRMKQVKRFASVCNMFLLATMTISILQLCALFEVFSILGRHWGALRVAKAMLEMVFFWVLFYLLNAGETDGNRVMRKNRELSMDIDKSSYFEIQ